MNKTMTKKEVNEHKHNKQIKTGLTNIIASCVPRFLHILQSSSQIFQNYYYPEDC